MNAVILCDGRPPSKTLIKEFLKENTLFIAADGGAITAKRLDLTPDVIIGDMDSYSPKKNEKSIVISDPDQETNDLEKALQYAKQKSIKQVTVFGATGQRLDHTLKNLSVMKQYHSSFDSLIYKDEYSDIFLINSPFQRKLPIGTSVSLFPLSGKVLGVTTRGLKYSLSNGVLENGVQDGSSNETINHDVEIEFKKGDLLLFINHKKNIQ